MHGSLDGTPRILTTGQVARICRVAASTVIDWTEQGKLRCFKIPGRGHAGFHRRIETRDLAAFLRDAGMTAALESLRAMDPASNGPQSPVSGDGTRAALRAIRDARLDYTAGESHLAFALRLQAIAARALDAHGGEREAHR